MFNYINHSTEVEYSRILHPGYEVIGVEYYILAMR